MLATQLVNRNLLDFIPLSENYMVMQITPPDWAFGKTLMQLDLRKRFGVFVIAVKEHVPERTAFLPGPDLVVKDTHYHSVIRRTVFTNTDWNLIRTCPAPLLLAKPGEWRAPPTLLAALDPGHLGDKPAALDHDILDAAQLLAGTH